jgi:hypothetical protein
VRGIATIVAVVGLLSGCQPVPELRLMLVGADPDPLATAVSVRVSYLDGSMERTTVEAALDGPAGEASTGVQGDLILDVVVEAIDAAGEVVARGRRNGDLTPVGDDRSEPILVLQVGRFSTVPSLALHQERIGPCVAQADPLAGRVLVAGGGPGRGAVLDLQTGTWTDGEDELTNGRIGCSAVRLGDGSVVIAGGGSGLLEVVDADGGLIEAPDSGRTDGALASLQGGQAAWWAGGSGDGADMTSELVREYDSMEPGPTVVGEARTGLAVGCGTDAGVCAVFGSDGEPDGWWQAEAQDLLDAADGMDPLRQDHDDPPIAGRGVAAGPLDSACLVGLTEEGASTHVLVFDVSGDGALELDHVVPGGLVGCSLAAPGRGEAWVLGGTDAQGVTAQGQVILDDGEGWRAVDAAPALSHGRAYAASVTTADGRVAVVGGVDDDGDGVLEVEIYQP